MTLLADGEMQLLASDDSQPLLERARFFDTEDLMQFNRTLQQYPPIFVPRKKTLLEKLKHNDRYVYETNSIIGKYLVDKECKLIEIKDSVAEADWLSFVFKKKSNLVQIMNDPIQNIQSSLKWVTNTYTKSGCFRMTREVRPLNLSFFQVDFFILFVGLGAAGFWFVLEFVKRRLLAFGQITISVNAY